MEFKGQVAIVTGAGRGQGKATAELFVRAGADVVAADLDGNSAAEACRSFPQDGGTATPAEVDVTDGAQVQRLVDQTVEQHGRIDALINNAGITLFKSIYDTTEDDWDRVLNTNLKSMFLTAKAVLPVMRAQGAGSIVNIASTNGIWALINHSAYCASKAGAVNFTRALALDVARQGIRVNCICPGPVATEMLEEAADHDPVRYEQMGTTTPLGRIAEPEEIGRVSLFLCSPAASFITGAILPVDGGRTSGRGYG